MKYVSILLIYVLFFLNSTTSQESNTVFHDITVKDGLNDGLVTLITQDKYGYIWLGTLGGLNRYNGSSSERFTHIHGDSTSAPEGIPYALSCGPDGRLWIGYESGLYEFDYITNSFKKHAAINNWYTYSIKPAPNNELYLLTNAGFLCYNSKLKTIIKLQETDSTLKKHNANHLSLKGNQLYIGSTGGYMIHNIQTKQTVFKEIPGEKDRAINKILIDKNNQIWMAEDRRFRLLSYDEQTKKLTVVSDHPVISSNNQQLRFTNLLCDDNNNIWISTSSAGIIKYDAASKRIQQILPPKKNATAYITSIYQTTEGHIWAGRVGDAIYFKPEKNLFSTIFPFPQKETNQLGRAVRQDNNGNFWFTTGLGISFYHPLTGTYKVWRNDAGKQNMIYNNSVRGVETGSDNVVWIATGGGIQSYNPATGEMRFWDEKDSIPKLFYYSANKDSKGRIWFGTNRRDGLYYYNEPTKTFHSVAAHALLKKYLGHPARIVFEDSRQRIWVGYGDGLAMVDERNNNSRFWHNDDKSRNTIIGNTVIDIKEDKKGIIWVSTFNGVTGIDVSKEEYYWINRSKGLSTNITSALVVDERDRLWIGTAAGLYMLDEKRENISYYDESSGLLSAEFTEHSGYRLKDGSIMMPTFNGYVKFQPNDLIVTGKKLKFYIAAVDVFNKRRNVTKETNASLTLKAHENSFSILLEALNFNKTSQTWYAYKLQGFDKDWHYTNDAKAVYTNVPGGTYQFLYKAAFNNNFSDVKEKTLVISLQRHFYKSNWFWILMAAIFAFLLFILYRFRLEKQREILSLETKAETLEKEKTLVQYESLKQQLNPHFLFNSLTSLRSLIKTDAKAATGFLDGLSKVYRYVLKSGEQELILLKDEVEFVKTFIELQKTRFKEGLQVRFEIEDEYLYKYIAPVTVQNLVENAIKHNTADTESPLLISIYTDDDYIVVKNNLQRYRIVETSNKKGLAGIQTLYRFYTDKPVEIIEDEQFFTVKIPLL